MAMKVILPSSTVDSSSSSRRCIRISPCFFISGLLLFFLLVQLDLIPQVDLQQVRDLQSQVSRYLHKIRSSPSPPPPPPPSSSSSLPPLPPPPPSLASSLSSALSPSPLTSPPSPFPPPPSSSSSSSKSSPRVAICLVGGARAFELTGPTIKKYLLQAMANSDVFVHAPLDKDSYKLSLLKDLPNLVHVRIFSPKTIPETQAFTDVLTASNSPNGIQGLLQYFSLVEGCVGMINQHQLQYNLTYEWIIRTRLDGYWNNYLPSLDKMDHTGYTVPLGSQFGGLNDRLGIGNWEISKVALSRLSLVPVLHAHGARGLNSESSFKQQLKVRKVEHRLHKFPFCILSHRRYGWPPGHWGVPVLSISSKGNLNGAKCRPCTPVSTGGAAQSAIAAQARSWAWPGSIEGPELCNPTSDWERNWEGIFDRVAGLENATIRKIISNQTLNECNEAYEALQKQVKVWDAPLPSVICEKGLGAGSRRT